VTVAAQRRQILAQGLRSRRGCGTNDDGITSPGLLALKDLLTEVGRVTVLAPNHNYISVTPIQLDLTAHAD
jgi:broad specificity polyphosphatase/5'/3'-nucleotidase SurE